MNIRQLHTWLFALVIILSTGCKKEDDNLEITYSTDYFPLNEGRFVTYQVNDTTYDDFFNPVKVEISEYQLKVVIDSIVDLGLNNFRFTMRRFKRDSIGQQFKLKDNWLGEKNNDRLILYEENVPYMKLAFPIRISFSWDGNAFNTNAEEAYSYVAVSAVINDSIAQSSELAEVLQRNRLNLIERIYGSETYAVGIGMINKKDINLRTAIDGEVESGYKRHYKLLDYGME